ncbi:hypothetical protein BDK51DRAFT_14308, partial [Blyttiomyces helicus]
VYHMDGQAKHQGVVYCEMASRENTEPDLLDSALRRLLYSNTTTYSRECGGRTEDILNLTNDEIIAYHRQFYHLSNLTIVVCGILDPHALFAQLNAVPGLLEINGVCKIPVLAPPPFPGGRGDVLVETVRFPTSDEEVGSLAFAWRGPPSEDIFTILAIEILFRYLCNTSASPFSQAFVERKDPYASQVDYDVKSYTETSFSLIFSGVPYSNPDAKEGAEVADGEEEDEEEPVDGDVEMEDSDEWEDEEDEDDDDEDDDSEDDEDDKEEDPNPPRKDLFSPGIFRGLMLEVLEAMQTPSGAPTAEVMQATIQRHRRKILESLEDYPHESLESYLLPDIIRHRFAASSSLGDTLAQGGGPVIGTRGKMLEILDQLAERPVAFWVDLARTWLLERPMVEVLMVPDRKAADENSRREHEAQKARVDELGEEGLRKLKEEVDRAVKENEINVPQDLLDAMPPVPDVTRAPRLRAAMQTTELPPSSVPRPFSTLQTVSTETAFAHLRFGLPIAAIPPTLRPHLVLLQELLFQSPLYTSATTPPTDYRVVVREAAALLVSHEAAVGFGNDIWSASWLSSVFMLAASAETADAQNMTRFVVRVLLRSLFVPDRIATVAKNLLSEITEIKREGSEMLSAITTRITFARARGVGGGNNDAAISLFVQEGFLRDVLARCRSGRAPEVVAELTQLRNLIVAGAGGGPGFVQIAGPAVDPIEASAALARVWDEEIAACGVRMEGVAPVEPRINPFPFPRVPYAPDMCDAELGRSVMVPIAGLATSFLTQIVPCDVLRVGSAHPDTFAVTILAELLSRTEGPLYTAIRGQGYAYGASLYLSTWSGQLALELHDASEHRRGLAAFYDILATLSTPAGFDDLCAEFHIESARAS